MDKLDKLIEKAKLKAPGMFIKNEYLGIDNNELLDMLAFPREDWREVAQAIVLNGGGFREENQT